MKKIVKKKPFMCFIAGSGEESALQEYKDIAERLGFWLGKHNETTPIGYIRATLFWD